MVLLYIIFSFRPVGQDLKRKLQEWTLLTQHGLEREKAELLTNSSLQVEDRELRAYINTHLNWYLS